MGLAPGKISRQISHHKKVIVLQPFENRIKIIPKLIALTTAAISIVLICIWIFVPSLKEFSALSMKLNTALALFTASLSLWLLADEGNPRSWQSKCGQGLALLTLLIGLSSFSQYIFKINLHIDELFVSDFRNDESILFPGRMSPIACICFIFIGAALFFINRPGNRWIHPTSLFIFPVFLICTFSLLGYVYEERSFYQIGPFIRIAWQTTTCCLLLTTGILAARQRSRSIYVLARDGLGGMIARRLFPVVAIAPVFFGYLWLHARRSDVVDRELGISLFVIAIILVFIVVITFISNRLDQMDARERAMTDNERDVQKKLMSVLDNSSVITWTLDRLGNIEYSSGKALSFIGFETQSLVGQNFFTLFGDEFPQAAAMVRRALGGETFTNELSMLGRMYNSNYSPVFNSSGQITGVAVVSNDITELKITEQALADSERQFRMMANSIPQLAWMANKDGWVFWLNEKWYDYTGTTLPEMEGWGWQKVLDPADGERMTASWKKALESGEPWEDTFPIRSKSGESRWFLSRALPIRNDHGEITFWFGTNTDIHEKQRNERELVESKDIAEKANKAKTQFLANMSHEIRTPIGAIMGFTQLLKNAPSSEVDRETFMDIIERNSQTLLRLIDDILDLSKVESGKFTLDKSEFSLSDLLKDVSSILSLKAAEKGIAFSLEIDGLIPEKICTDQLRLRQILINVIGNAVKFTSSGKVTVHVSCTESLFEASVEDTGPGIPLKNQRFLFHAFSQADPSMTRKFGGTGLGLALSKRLSQALGGDVYLLRSKVNKGSTFVIRTVVETAVGTRMISKDDVIPKNLNLLSKIQHEGFLEGLKVLLVEDSLDNRILISTYLRDTGAIIETAVDGEKGVEIALKNLPDVTLMDIQMPIMDGHTAVRSLRSQGYSKPIIALTAHAMREERDKCFESGCNDYLTKPIVKNVLVDVLSRYVRNRVPPVVPGTSMDPVSHP